MRRLLAGTVALLALLGMGACGRFQNPALVPLPGDRYITVIVGATNVVKSLDVKVPVTIKVTATNAHKQYVLIGEGREARDYTWTGETVWGGARGAVISQQPNTEPPHELHVEITVIPRKMYPNVAYTCSWYGDPSAHNVLLKQDISTLIDEHTLGKYAKCRIGVRFNDAGGITLMEK